jgi:hypothetical protein
MISSQYRKFDGGGHVDEAEVVEVVPTTTGGEAKVPHAPHMK